MIEWFKKWQADRAKQQEINEIARTAIRVVKQYWNTGTFDYYRSYTREHGFENTFIVGDVKVKVFREIRGDLVEFFINETPIITYVDQSHQLPDILGTNDWTINISLADFRAALGES